VTASLPFALWCPSESNFGDATQHVNNPTPSSSSENNSEGPEGVKWELGFGKIFTGKVGPDLGHWDWDLVTGNGNHRQKNNRTATGIFKIWKNNRLGNGIWAKFGLGKWDLYPPSRILNSHVLL